MDAARRRFPVTPGAQIGCSLPRQGEEPGEGDKKRARLKSRECVVHRARIRLRVPCVPDFGENSSCIPEHNGPSTSLSHERLCVDDGLTT